MKVVVQGQGEKSDFILIEPTKFIHLDEVEAFVGRLLTVAKATLPRKPFEIVPDPMIGKIELNPKS